MAETANSSAVPVDVEVGNPCLLVEHKKTQEDLTVGGLMYLAPPGGSLPIW